MPTIKSSDDLRNNYNEISIFCHNYPEPFFDRDFPSFKEPVFMQVPFFMPYNPKGYMSYFSSFSFSKSFMLLTLIAKVDVLCKSADVAGCITPPIPHKINPVLKPTICR